MTDTLTTRQFSAISEHSLIQGTPSNIREWLMSLPPDSLVSPFRLRESEKESQTPEIFGRKPKSAYAWYDPDSFCWKTYQGSLLTGTYDEFSETWPRAGMIVDGKLYLRQKWERRINVIGSGFWRTPHASDGEGGVMEMREGVAGHYKLRDHVQEKNKRYWPTPSRGSDTGGQGIGLTGGSGNRHKFYEMMKERGYEKPEKLLGQLNPDWVEWLMGWPIGTSRLEPMEEIVWLGWEIDPADGGANLTTAVKMWPSPRAGNPGSRPNQKGGKILAEEAKKINGGGPIPRVTTNTKDRVNRLKALGNGMVPLCVALAWKILSGIKKERGLTLDIQP